MVFLRHPENKSSSIPIPRSHVGRTYSETQLENDTKLYQWREGVMYHRLICGMLQRSKEVGSHPKTNRSVLNIMHTQASPISASPATADTVTSGSSTSSSDDDEWLLYEDSSGESGYTEVPLTMGRPQDCTRACSLNSRCESCPTLHMGMEQDEPHVDDDIIFELDL
ncbi:hypothetical protein ACHAXR_009811 [Thalassiosira sp. AJA248-18]